MILRASGAARPVLTAAVALTVLILAVASPAQELELKLLSLTSPVAPGDDATLTLQTAAAARCTIMVRYKSGPSRAKGLVAKRADREGRVSWTWRVGTRTTPGTWPVTVTCAAGEQEGTLKAALVVR